MACISRRRNAVVFILFTLTPISSSVSWRSLGTARIINKQRTRYASKRRPFNCISSRSRELLDEEEEDWYDSDCDSDNDDSPLLKNEPLSAPAALSLSGGGNANAQRHNNNPFSNLIGRGGNSNSNNNKTNIKSQLHSLQSLKRQKLMQLHKSFRQKQRSFQSALYTLNSQSNPSFPPPPYNLWRLQPPSINQSTLTSKLFSINIATFVLQSIYPALTAWGAKRSDLLLRGQQLHRLVTPIFLHGGVGHLMANSYSLKSMGDNVEQSFGKARFLSVYFASGVAGNILSAIKSPNPAVGASGAIFGLVGAYYTFLSRNSHVFGYYGELQQNALIQTIGMNLLLGLTNPMIDNWGHIGGFLGGVGVSYAFGPRLFVVNVPVGEDKLSGGGFGVGKVVVDRPFVVLRVPEVLEERYFLVREGVRGLGLRVSGAVSKLFGSGGDRHYYFDDSGSGLGNDGVYKLVNGKEGNVANLSGKAHRQDVSELDPIVSKQIARGRRRSMPRPGSMRRRYGHYPFSGLPTSRNLRKNDF